MSQERKGEHQSKIRRIIFAGENHFSGTLYGTKLNTLRVFRPEAHDLKEGEYFVGEFSEEAIQLVLQATSDTDKKLFRELSAEDLQNNGYEGSIEEALEDMRTFYPNLTLDTQMAVINYKVPEINGTPVIRYSDQ